jgi:enamine deaminase RidA (YjgF/YER057c/UK114 family)
MAAKPRAKAKAKPKRVAAAARRTVPDRAFYGVEPPFPISLAVRAGDFVFTSALADHGFDPEKVVFDGTGLVLSDGTVRPKITVEEETRRVLESIKDALALAGCTMADIVDTSVWLRDPRDFVPMNRAFRDYFKRSCPSRSVFRIDFMFDCRVEIKVIAYKPLAGRVSSRRAPR